MSIFIPSIKHTNGYIEVFTTKYGGMFFDDIVHASLYVSDHTNEFWHCTSKGVAKNRANETI